MAKGNLAVSGPATLFCTLHEHTIIPSDESWNCYSSWHFYQQSLVWNEKAKAPRELYLVYFGITHIGPWIINLYLICSHKEAMFVCMIVGLSTAKDIQHCLYTFSRTYTRSDVGKKFDRLIPYSYPLSEVELKCVGKQCYESPHRKDHTRFPQFRIPSIA